MTIQLSQANKKSKFTPAAEQTILRKSENDALHEEHPQSDATLQMKSVYRASNGGVPPDSSDTDNTLNNSRLCDYLKVQPKLTVGRPDDKYEREADRVADQVMRTPEDVRPGIRMPANDTVQRGCSSCMAEENPLNTKFLSTSISPLVQIQPVEEEESLQTKAADNSHNSITWKVESDIQSTKGGGQPLSISTRSHLEPKFGYDFSRVKIYNDVQSDSLNRSLNARAFTTGKDIFFRHGEYNQETSKGKRLLAHELTHVVQQDNMKLQRTQMIQRKCTNAAGQVIYILRSSGNLGGYSKIKQGAQIWFQNRDTKPHTIKVIPKGLFLSNSNSSTVAPGAKLTTWASRTTKMKHGSIYDGPPAHRAVEDVTICP